MELNDTTDYQLCFACGQHNPFGLQMVFRQEDESVVSDFRPQEEHQGFPGIIHGGIVAAVLDEALNRTTMLTNHPTWSMTGRLEIRYRRYVPYGPLLRARARPGKLRGRLLQATGYWCWPMMRVPSWLKRRELSWRSLLRCSIASCKSIRGCAAFLSATISSSLFGIRRK